MFYLLISLFGLANSNDVFSIRCLLSFFVGFFVIKVTSFCREVFSFVVKLFFTCREVFSFAVKLFLFAARFFLLRDSCGPPYCTLKSIQFH